MAKIDYIISQERSLLVLKKYSDLLSPWEDLDEAYPINDRKKIPSVVQVDGSAGIFGFALLQ